MSKGRFLKDKSDGVRMSKKQIGMTVDADSMKRETGRRRKRMKNA
jgi:hypothetical protein